MQTEEFSTLRTELLITQQQNTCIKCDVSSLRRSLRLAKRVVAVTGGQLRNANIKIDDLNWQLEGTYSLSHPSPSSPPSLLLPQYLNPIPYDIIVNKVQINILNICHAFDNTNYLLPIILQFTPI